jgi:transcriptional regulator with XRE-family HTH domain
MNSSTYGDARPFDEQVARLKRALGVADDQAVAKALGLSKAAFSNRKQRGAFPEDKLFALATRRPELKLDVRYVISGKSIAEEVVRRLDAFPARLVELRGELELKAFAKHVGIPQGELAQLEAGRALPTADHIVRLAKAFPEHSASWIAGGPRLKLDDELSDLEVILIRNYRLCSAETRASIRRAAAAGASQDSK